MKKLLLLLSIIYFGCSGSGGDHVGTTQGSDYCEVTITEYANDSTCEAEVHLIKEIDTYDHVTLTYNGNEYQFINNYIDMQVYADYPTGNVPCAITFYDDENNVIQIVNDTIKLYIETWYFSVKNDLGSPANIMQDNDSIQMFPANLARGNDAICWLYDIRIPYGKSVSFSASTNSVFDNNPIENGQVLEIHYRGYDYRFRDDLYTPPDESMFHIDTETDKWITVEPTRSQGIHHFYVAPSIRHDKSYMVITHSGDISGTVDGYFKSLDWDALGLP